MAVRRCALFLGDESAAGTRPVSELAGINPAYDDAQSDCFIWNPTAGAWQNLEPGVNTNPSAGAPSDRWGPEVRFRESIRGQFPTGNWYVIKHAIDSTMTPTSSKPTWSPQITGSLYTQLLTILTNAAAAANAAGDSLRIEAIYFSLFTDDFKLRQTYRSYGNQIAALLLQLRETISTIQYCGLGTINAVLGQAHVLVMEPAYKTTGLTSEQQFALTLCRGGLFALDNDGFSGLSVMRSSQFSMAADNKTFSAAAMVAIGNSLSSYLFPATPSWTTEVDAPFAITLGDSINEGTGINAELPSHLQGTLTGVNFWNFRTGAIEALNVTTNNQITLAPGTFHGVEVKLGDLFRADYGNVWMLKAAAPGSMARLWHPLSEKFYWFGMVMPWLLNMIDQMKAAGKKPVLKFVSICLGTNDILNPQIDTSGLKSSLVILPPQIEYLFQKMGLDTTGCKFIYAIPAQSVSGNSAQVTKCRQIVSELPEANPDWLTVDLDGKPTLDNIHPNTVGTTAYASDIYEKFKESANAVVTASVAPLFAPSRDMLVKALRLSGVKSTNDAAAMIDAAIQTVRTGFVQNLGQPKVDVLRQMPFNTTPETEKEHFRTLSYLIEVKWCRMELLRSMPTLFMDGTSRIQSWQDEAAFRETSYLQTKDELARLRAEVAQGLDTLKKLDLSQVASGIIVSTVSPDDSIRPGDTVFSQTI